MLNVFGVITCSMYGLTDAGASTVGALLGGGRPGLAKEAAGVLVRLMVVMAGGVAVLLLVTQDYVGSVFSTDSEVVELSSR